MPRSSSTSKRVQHALANRENPRAAQAAPPRESNKALVQNERQKIVVSEKDPGPKDETPKVTVHAAMTVATNAVVDLNDETLTEILREASQRPASDPKPAEFDSDAKQEVPSRSDSLELGYGVRQGQYLTHIDLPQMQGGNGAYGLGVNGGPAAMTQEQKNAFNRDFFNGTSTAPFPPRPRVPWRANFPAMVSPTSDNGSTATPPSPPNSLFIRAGPPLPLRAGNPKLSWATDRPNLETYSSLPLRTSLSDAQFNSGNRNYSQPLPTQSSHEPAPDPPPASKPSIYCKLQPSEIRLVRIQPFSSGPMKISLRPIPIQKPPPYTALSYAWGDNKDSVEVEVNGLPTKITSNLFQALRTLQSNDRDVLCWADALAINQKDKEEVTAQVRMMKKIYSTAASVTIWLGPKSVDSDMALELIQALSSNTVSRNDGNIRRLIKSREHQPAFTALVSLFERDYWRRLWVVQEVLNARYVNVLCGSSSMPWTTYQRATDVLHRLSEFIDRTYSSWLRDNTEPLYISPKSRMSYSEVFLQLGPASFEGVESLLWSDSDSDAASNALKLQKALCMCRSKFAANARDKVYGLLGVLPEDVQDHIVPDYNLSIKDVFTNAAEYIISKTKRLDVLGSAFHFPVHISPLGLPSWVPDWSHISHMTPIDWPAGRFHASAATKSRADLDDQHHRILSTWAIEVDRVAEQGIPVGTINTVNNFIMSFMHWHAMLQKHLRDSDEAQKVRAEDSFCRTIALDNIHPLFQAQDKWRRVTFHLFASLSQANVPELPLHSRLAEFATDGCVDLHNVSRNTLIQEIFSPSMTGRSFFFTRSGIMGMGSGYLVADDLAVVPLGCSTPLLLRKDGDDGEFRFVSDAYLDRYMYGKAVNDWSNGLLEPDRFNIH